MAKPRLNRISIVLDEFDFSQKDLSEHLHVSKNTVSRWCRNINQPDLDKLYTIVRFFRIDIGRLIEKHTWENETGPVPYTLFLENKAKTLTTKQRNSKKK